MLKMFIFINQLKKTFKSEYIHFYIFSLHHCMLTLSKKTLPLKLKSKHLNRIFVHIKAESLNSVTNSDVADTDGVEVQIKIQIYFLDWNWVFSGSFIAKNVHLYLDLNFHALLVSVIRTSLELQISILNCVIDYQISHCLPY